MPRVDRGSEAGRRQGGLVLMKGQEISVNRIGPIRKAAWYVGVPTVGIQSHCPVVPGPAISISTNARPDPNKAVARSRRLSGIVERSRSYAWEATSGDEKLPRSIIEPSRQIRARHDRSPVRITPRYPEAVRDRSRIEGSKESTRMIGCRTRHSNR